MTFGVPIAAQTVALAAAVLGGLAVLAYVLKMRRRRYEVPFSLLWQRVLAQRESTSLFKQLRRLLSLLLILTILGLLLLAVTDPQLGEPDDDATSVVLIVDASASMMARDAGEGGEEPRIEAAREAAHGVLSSLGGADAAMIVKMDGRATPLTRFETDLPALRRAVDDLRATATPADLRRALETAADALRGRQRPTIILIGDGNYPPAVADAVAWGASEGEAGGDGEGEGDQQPADELSAIDLEGIDVRFVPVGEATENVGITRLGVRRYVTNRLAYEAFLEVQNFGDEPAAREVVLYDGDVPIEVSQVELAPGERRRALYPDLGGGEGSRLRAVLRPAGGAEQDAADDAFPVDDEAFALLPARSQQRVLLVTRDNLYLEGAILVYDHIAIDKLTPSAYESALAAGDLPDYDVVVYDDYTPKARPPSEPHALYFGPEGAHSPFPIERALEAPRITDAAEHPVTRWLVLDDVNIDAASVFGVRPAAGEVSLVKSVRAPIAAAKRDGGRRVVAFGFSLGGTDLTLRVAFPLLLVNTLDWFAGDDADLIATYATGEPIRLPIDGTYEISRAELRSPSGRRQPAAITGDHISLLAEEVGVHEITASHDGSPVARIQLAANLADPGESAIAPNPELELGGRVIEAPESFEPGLRRSLWRYLALAALLLVSVEWLTYHRRITV